MKGAVRVLLFFSLTLILGMGTKTASAIDPDPPATPPSYCNTPWGDCSFDDYISNVSLSGENGTAINQGSSCGDLDFAYSWYQTPVVDLEAGMTYTLTITNGQMGSDFSGETIAAWIDFNNNHTFQATEKLGNYSYATGDPAAQSFTFTVPIDAALGQTLMRVRMAWGNTSFDACEQLDWGETEDYWVNILAPQICNEVDQSSITQDALTFNSSTLSWDASSPAPTGGYDYYYSTTNTAPDATTNPSGNTANTSVTLSGLNPNTQYFFWVRAHCTAALQSDWTDPAFEFTTPCDTPNVNLGGSLEFCSGSALTINAGNSGSTFDWSTSETTQSIQVTTPGTYSVTVTNAFGCSNADTVTVIENPLPVVDLGNDTTICDGESVTLDAGNAGSTYSWSNGASSQTINITNSGTYHVTVTDGNGCATTSSDFTLGIYNLPIVDLGPGATICIGDTVSIDAGNPGDTYLWSNGETTQIIDVTVAGTYTVNVTDANNCENSGSVMINPGLEPNPALPDSVNICDSAIATLNAGNSGSTFLWNTTETTQTIQTNQAGSYSVAITSVDNCSIIDTVEVIVNANPVSVLEPTYEVCAGSSLTLDAGNPGSTYSWSTGETTQTIQATDSGHYTVVITNAAHCSILDHVQVEWYPTASIDGFDFVPLFYEELGKVQFYPINPQHVQFYFWDFGDEHGSTIENPVHTYTEAGDYMVTLEVFGEEGCNSYSLTLPIHVDLSTTGIDDVDMSHGLTLYPNPSNDQLTVKLNNPDMKMTQLSVFDMTGRLVLNQRVSMEQSHQISVSNLASGIYSIKIQTNSGEVVHQKFEVRH